MSGIFKDKHLQEAFEQSGFVQMGQLTKGEVAHLLEAYQAPERVNETSGFHATMHCTKATERARVDELLKSVLAPYFTKFLLDYEALFANYIVKEPTSDSAVGVHQDWSYVDETKYTAVNVWIPLVDTSDENGPLYVLPRSHRLSNALRFTPFDNKLYEQINEEVEQYAEKLILKAGEILWYDGGLIHYSPPNHSSKIRPAIGFVTIPKKATPCHYYRNPSRPNHLEIYEVSAQFFLTFEPDNPVFKRSMIGTAPDTSQAFTGEQLAQFYQKKGRVNHLVNTLKSIWKHF